LQARPGASESPSDTLCRPPADLNSDSPGNGIRPGGNQNCHQLTDNPEARPWLNKLFDGELDGVLQEFQRQVWAA